VVTIAVNFPTSLDALTNPVASDATNSVSVPHATQHANLNDAVEALEARVGITGSAVTSSLTYRIATVETIAATVRVGAWDAWSPVVTQSATPTCTLANNYSMKESRSARATASISFTSAGTAANKIVVPLPYACDAASAVLGTFYYFDAGTGYHTGVIVYATTTTANLLTTGATDLLGINPALTIASGDNLVVDLDYRSAS